MYPKAAIKASFPKKLCDHRIEIANKVSFAFDEHPDGKKQSHERRCAPMPLTHWLKKTSDEKRGTPKMQEAC
jgi:hypothetical protein